LVLDGAKIAMESADTRATFVILPVEARITLRDFLRSGREHLGDCQSTVTSLVRKIALLAEARNIFRLW
jgi:hypothetical protein